MEEYQRLAAALVAPYMNDGRIVNLLAKAFEPDYDPPKAGRSTIDFPEAQWVPVIIDSVRNVSVTLELRPVIHDIDVYSHHKLGSSVRPHIIA